MANTFAERLLLCRRDIDITQEDLARVAGKVSPAYISSLERGKVTNPTVDVVEALAKALGVQAGYLLGWIDDPLGEDKPASVAEGRVVYQVGSQVEYRQVQDFLDIWPDLSPDDKQLLLDMAKRLQGARNARIIGQE